ncbi:MAG TPA: hypothetical protein VK832_14075 [Burkholderiaceae bacterium]|nr:hypothetical protein [Burkholderiaceae bacterium]
MATLLLSPDSWQCSGRIQILLKNHLSVAKIKPESRLNNGNIAAIAKKQA